MLKLQQDISKDLNIPLFYTSNDPLMQFIFEVLHFKLRFAEKMVQTLR